MGKTCLVLAVVTAAVAAATFVVDAEASQRRFTYTYESLVLNQGEVEIEPWTTFRIGKEDYYVRMDERVEFEIGVTNSLQTALYLNWRSTSAQVGDEMETELEWKGISNEWKWKLRDPVADPFGFALYFEWSASTNEAEIETKIIADKRAGNWLFAFNGVFEPEWEFEVENEEVEAENEINFEFNLAGAYFVSTHTALGIEVRNHNLYLPEDGGYQHSALFAGPVVSYSAETWWAALTVLPQIAKLKGSEADEDNDLVLSELEKVEVRLLLGLDL